MLHGIRAFLKRWLGEAPICGTDKCYKVHNDFFLSTREQVKELYHYHNLHHMGEIRGRVDSYLIALMIQAYYSQPDNYKALDAQGREIVAYLGSVNFYKERLSDPMFPKYPFMEAANHESCGTAVPPIHYEPRDGWYAILNGRRLYLSNDESGALTTWAILNQEQNPLHPHCYCDDEKGFTVQEGDIVCDIGAAEGFFVLKYLDRIKHAYVFEPDERWFSLLQKTYAPYSGKVTLVKGSVGETGNEIRLDDFFRDKQPPTFLKMDVEGAEPTVLRGMERLLRNSELSMCLAVCTYHRQEDASWIESFLGPDFSIEYSNSYYWHLPDPMPPFLRRGVMRVTKERNRR